MKAVVFDMDGVIFDTEKIWKEAVKASNKVFGVRLSEKYRQSFCGMTDLQTREKLRADHAEFDTDAYRDYMNQYVKDKINNFGVPLKNRKIEKIIANLRNAGFKIALATGSPRERVDKQFSFVGVDVGALFDAVVTSSDVKHGKPDPEVYLSACKKLGVEPAEAYAVEDGLNGIRSAYAAGLHPLMSVDLIKPNKEAKQKCEKIFRNLNQVERYVLKQNRKVAR